MHSHQSGFSLLQLSIILTVSGLVLASMLPGGEAGGTMAKTRITLERMEKIEEATRQFMAKNQRRPYPADITAAFSAAAFGKELSVPTDYSTTPTTHYTHTVSTTADTTASDATLTDILSTASFKKSWMVSSAGNIAANSWVEAITTANDVLEMNRNASATSNDSTLYFRNPLVAGAVPTKALGLPDEMAIDGFGRRIVYMVDARATVSSNCSALQNDGLQGALALSSSSTFSTGTYDHVMWALLSHGADGQGAVGIQGSTLTNRIKTGNVDASTLNNAFYDSSQVLSFNIEGLVNKPATATFDDIVWTSQRDNNTCALGRSANSFRDFRVDGGGSGTNTAGSAAFGDINGDGYQDLIYGVAQQNLVRVIYGKKDNWPEPTTAYTSSALDGSNGFTITKGTENVSSFGTNIAIGDFNGDGYDDIVTGGLPVATTDNAYAVIFGASSHAATSSISTLSGNDGILLTNFNVTNPVHVTVGDVNGDGFDDISMPFYAAVNDWAQGVIYGKASGWSNITMNTAFFNGTNGVYFNVTTPNAANGDVSYGSTSGSKINRKLAAICDVDGNGYKDLIIPGVLTGSATITPQRVYVMPGAASWSHTSGFIDPSAAASMLTFSTSTADPAPYDILAIACKDISSDGLDDIIAYQLQNSGSQEYVYVYFGRTFTPPSTTDIDANYDIQLDLTASSTTWRDYSSIPNFVFGDVNNDGKTDMILTRRADDPYVSISGSTFVLETTNTGTARANAGVDYILFQPASWGTTPSLEKDFYGDYTFDGTDGIAIIGATSDDHYIFGTADMNKDSKTDLILSNSSSPNGGYFIFGKDSWPSPYDLNCTRDTSGAHCTDQISAR